MVDTQPSRRGSTASTDKAPFEFLLGKPSGLTCPACGSENCESFAWASNYFSRDDVEVPETWIEPEDDPAKVAERCAKPAFPKTHRAWQALDFVLSLGSLGLTLYLTGSFWLALVPAVVIHIGMFIAWSKLFAADRLREHEARVEAWKHQHLCMDCGHTFAL